MKNLLFRKLQIVKQSVHVRGQIRNCGTHETKQPFASPFSNYGIIGIYARACNSLAEVPLRQEMTRPDSNSVVLLAVEELNAAGEFTIPGFAKFSVVIKPATEARKGINPFTKEPMDFAAKPASKAIKARPLKVAKDAV